MKAILFLAVLAVATNCATHNPLHNLFEGFVKHINIAEPYRSKVLAKGIECADNAQDLLVKYISVFQHETSPELFANIMATIVADGYIFEHETCLEAHDQLEVFFNQYVEMIYDNPRVFKPVNLELHLHFMSQYASRGDFFDAGAELAHFVLGFYKNNILALF